MREKEYSTFINLPRAKQRIILQAGIAEFSEWGYAKASCNRIVKTAGISKGSLFQYFGSKEGFFVFICSKFIRKVKDAVKQSGAADVQFFDLIRGVLHSGIQFIDLYPEYFLIYQKIMVEQDVPHGQDFLKRVRLFSVDYFGVACEKAKQSGLIRLDISTEMIVFSIDAMLEKFFMSYAGAGLGGFEFHGIGNDALISKINELVLVLEHGLSVDTA